MKNILKHKKKVALITGIAGQDGSYLSELLLSLDYKVYGIIRRKSIVEHQADRIEDIGFRNQIELLHGDMTDTSSLEKLVKITQPDEIYNLAAQSHVRISSEIPQFTAEVNALGVLNILEAYKANSPNAKFYQASSSEMFGNSTDSDKYQRETTTLSPTSPYGCAKVFGYNIVRHYRKAYNLFCSNGILFNHESPRRGSNFVTNKVVKTAVEIKLGLKNKLILGNLDSYRDWGHSKDYVRAMHLILQHNQADDFVVATGISRSVRDMCKYVFNKLDLNMNEYIKQDQIYMRPQELDFLRGDSKKARKILGWKPEINFEALMDEMIDHWFKILDK